MRLKHSLPGGALLVAAFAACTVTTTTGSTNTCSPDTTVAGCTAASTGYSCTGSESPEATNASLNCSVGVPGNAGATLFCCETGTTANTCTVDTTVTSCGAGSTGFSCAGSATPPQSNPSLSCGAGTAGTAGATLFCCTSSGIDAGGSCSPSTGPTTCTASSTEYTCSGPAVPVQANPALTCGPGIAGSGGSTLYCCAVVTAPGIDSGVPEAAVIDAASPDSGVCSVAAATGSANCDQCLNTQCCNALVACDTPDSAGVSDAGASACEQLLSCTLDCVAGNPDAGVAPDTLSNCQMVCNPSYTATEQQNASAVLTCQTSSCSSSCH